MERGLVWMSWVFCAVLVNLTVADANEVPSDETKGHSVVVESASAAEQQDAEIKDAPRFKHVSYPAAWTAAQETNRPILVYVSMPHCPHCDLMIDKTFAQPEVDSMVKSSFETLRVGRNTHAALVAKLNVKWFPTTVLVGPNNKVLDVIEGYVDASTFKRRLQLGIASATTSTTTQTR